MPVNRLKKFLMDLAQDPKKWVEFEEKPDEVMAAAGLSKAHRDALRSRDSDRIRKALGAGPRAFIVAIVGFKK